MVLCLCTVSIVLMGILQPYFLKAQGLELQRIRDFEAACEDEVRHQKCPKALPSDIAGNIPLTRERFEE